LIIADLQAGEVARRLAGPGLRLRTGPVVTEIKSRLPTVADGITLHYANHPAEETDGFADFHVRIKPPRGLRHWVRPQVIFEFDGVSPFLPLPQDQAFPILEWGLNWCVYSHCQQHLVIHAAGVEKGGRAVLLPAPPGSGKSTLCAAMINRGWRLLSDELAIFDLASGKLLPLARPVSLKNASIEVIRGFSQQAVIGPIVNDTVKGSVAYMQPPVESVHRAAESSTPGWIVLPRYVAGAVADLRPLSKSRAFMWLAENAFNRSLHGRRGFELFADIVDRCACYEFSYGNLDEAMTVFDRLSSEA
jgi:HprK-related kinase A